MHRWLWVVALAPLLAGCKAKPGKKWLERFQAAAKSKDADTCWMMISKESQEHFVAGVKPIKDIVHSGGELAEQFKADWKLEKEITAYSDEELAMRMLMRKEQEESVKSVFVEEKTEGARVLLTVDRGGKRETMVLIKEGGDLKYDFKATMEKNSP